VLKGKDFLCRLGRIKGDEAKASTFLSFLVVEDLNILNLAILFEGLFDLVS